ncbi:hypothetical protein BDV29DRAFT_162101 [Aspergillus leporis]|jgi:protein-arginine deiminase|uniref:Protein-arginine deiminase C-terminal domain-containing protein n=1 Tax=Aspergillus leporis TaxID=41062 RepID=A0A5N5WLR5_9EURO|nr:hypothetical protein BDV29DRAFT_162101 [Aspergillus leporis]
MKAFLFSTLFFTTNVASICFGFNVDIRADSNRDGIVDLNGTSDLDDKLSSSNFAGAILLPNIGDTDRRCSQLITNTTSSVELEACNDASDDIQRAPQFMAPLRTVPLPDLHPDSFGLVRVDDPVARANTRVFRRQGGQWVFTDSNFAFSASQLEAGLLLGIDARKTRTPNSTRTTGWDGRVAVDFTVYNGSDVATDRVILRVAPVLTHHHAQEARELLTTAGRVGENFFQARFLASLQNALVETRSRLPVFEFSDSRDIWAQDFVEPGYVSMPGPTGSVVLRVMIRSAQDDRPAGRQVFQLLRNTGRAAVQYLGSEYDQIDSMGNLETIPPYEHRNKRYPAGRIIMGRHQETVPYILEYMRAQELQDPLLLNTDCLAIGHVDEIVEFLPVNSSRGWTMLVADPMAGLQILQNIQRQGLGDIRAFSRMNDSEGNPSDLFQIPAGLHGVPSDSLEEVLSTRGIIEVNHRMATCIDENVQRLQEETGITDREIFRVPMMFRTGLTFPRGVGISSERNNSDHLAAALYPGVINNLVLSRSQIVAPKPWGPVVNGTDIMAAAAAEVYNRIGYNATYIDNWNSHHTWGGEVHCGTNTIRDATTQWW